MWDLRFVDDELSGLFFPTSVGTCLGPLMHLVQSWSVLVCLSVGSGRPLGPLERPLERFSQSVVGVDFREGDENSNFSVFRVRRFTEWPGPLH